MFGNRNKGFTLIELLVVIMIIVVLATIGLTSYSSANRRSRDARRAADLEQLRSALEMYRADNNTYPLSAGLLVSNYISALPVDPRTQVTYIYNALTSAGASCTVTPCTRYRVCAVSYETTPIPIGHASAQTGCSSGSYGVRNP
jgi:prepilin-type N-terminal cleavage/methylation domain-containing protein